MKYVLFILFLLTSPAYADDGPDCSSIKDRNDRPAMNLWKQWMWDNRCVIHYAVQDYGDSAREMHRVAVKGERPA